MARWIYRLDLTPHQRAALLTVLTDYVRQADSVEVSIDAATGAEIEIGDLLALVLNLEPIRDDGGVAHGQGQGHES